MRILTTTLVVTSLLAILSCGSNKENSSTQEGQDTASKTIVSPPSLDIHAATVLGDLDAIQQHILAGSDLDEREPSMNSTPLISASVFGKTEVARALIEAGADVNLQNNEGSTALHTAAFLCRTEIVEMLLENGADKDLRNVYGSTPIETVAGSYGDVKAIYDEFSKNLGPLGFKLDDEHVEATRPLIAAMLR